MDLLMLAQDAAAMDEMANSVVDGAVELFKLPGTVGWSVFISWGVTYLVMRRWKFKPAVK